MQPAEGPPLLPLFASECLGMYVYPLLVAATGHGCICDGNDNNVKLGLDIESRAHSARLNLTAV